MGKHIDTKSVCKVCKKMGLTNEMDWLPLRQNKGESEAKLLT